jgi:FecR protein
MVIRMRLLSAAALVGWIFAVSAYAQDVSTPPAGAAPANLAYVEGDVTIVHDGLAERADPPLMLIDGDIVRTRNGRAEIVFADGTILHLSEEAELEILAPERVRLFTGRALIRVSAAATRRYFVDTPAATVRLDMRGEYGITTDRQRSHVEVTVARGAAEIDDATQLVLVRAGEMASLDRAGARPLFQPFNSARWDAFAQWSNDRVNGFTNSRYAAQLPYELRPYAPVLEEYGRWDYLAPYGYVWYPSVSASWRPYFHGSWAHTRYGWTWYGRDRWAWPTHHFGRWGFNGSYWYWLPSKVWGPGWVTWGFAPGYVSWSPLGWDGHLAGRFWQRRDHPAYRPFYDPWRAWTVLPRDHFGRRSVRGHAIEGQGLDESIRRAMVMQSRPPSAPANIAVPRATLSAPGMTGNVRRGGIHEERPGNVRRPGIPTVPALPRPTPLPTMSDSAIRTPSSLGRRADDPAYAPSLPTIRSGSSQSIVDPTRTDGAERRGSIRYPASGDTTSSRSERPVVTAPSDTGSQAGEADTQSRDAGAQPRGTGRGLSDPSYSGRGGDGGRMSGRDSSTSGSSSGRSGSVREAGPRSAPSASSSGSSEGAGARSRGGSSGASSSGSSSSGSSSSGSTSGSAGGAVRRPPR